MALAAARARNARANCAGRRAIVVGGTSGIGHGIALRLAKANFGVTLVGRNAQRGQEIVAQMATLGGQNHEFMACDATLISNLRKLAVDVGKKYQAVDVLVETQGIASMEGRHETSEGLDQKLSLHAARASPSLTRCCRCCAKRAPRACCRCSRRASTRPTRATPPTRS